MMVAPAAPKMTIATPSNRGRHNVSDWYGKTLQIPGKNAKQESRFLSRLPVRIFFWRCLIFRKAQSRLELKFYSLY